MWALRPSEVGYTAACKQRMSHNPAAKDGVIDAGCTIMGSETYIVLVGNGFTTIGRGDQRLEQHRELKEKGDEHINIQDCEGATPRDPL